MRSRILRSISSIGAAMLCAASLNASAAAAGGLPQQSSQGGGGVSISVTPKEVSPSAKAWLFEVALNTHSTDLKDDLKSEVTLVDGKGKAQPAVAWEGDPAGGHHRRGVLSFNAPSPRPQALEVRIQRPGEAGARTFRWQLK